TLSAGFATSGMSLIGTLACLFHGCKTYSEYQEKVKENPSYFAWKVMNKETGNQSTNNEKPKRVSMSNISITNGSVLTSPKT
ncbi:hypothetical protein, partial [Aeromonas hydrophila]|uniref:hypothetical protein n=1 Tax=Aeromonas hydrophila TaxID=644 RepID=UPI0036DD99E5